MPAQITDRAKVMVFPDTFCMGSLGRGSRFALTDEKRGAQPQREKWRADLQAHDRPLAERSTSSGSTHAHFRYDGNASGHLSYRNVPSMLRIALVSCVVLTAFTTHSNGKNDCSTAYKNAIARLRHMQVSPERLAALSRRALRIYDACQTGDLEGANSFFEKLDRWRN
jgi:hypothetical protein